MTINRKVDEPKQQEQPMATKLVCIGSDPLAGGHLRALKSFHGKDVEIEFVPADKAKRYLADNPLRNVLIYFVNLLLNAEELKLQLAYAGVETFGVIHDDWPHPQSKVAYGPIVELIHVTKGSEKKVFSDTRDRGYYTQGW